MTTVGTVITQLDTWFPPALAEEWDAVGLVTGRRGDPVTRVALAVEVTDDTVQWALDAGAQLLFVHHPLFLRGTTNIDGDSAKGALVHRCITEGLAVFAAHTNADIARPGVSDALADVFGLLHSEPLRPHESNASIGLGRVGPLATPCRLDEFAQRIAGALPSARGAIRWAGDGARMIHTVALCGGAGDDLLDDVDADVYVTSDLRHHVAMEYLMTGRAALIDVPHAVAEGVWLRPLSHRLEAAIPGLAAVVYPGNTEPWAGCITS